LAIPFAVTGKFITFEGGEGAGKSSQVKRLVPRLKDEGYHVVTTREPGGTPAAEAIRAFVLSGKAVELGATAEAALMAAARVDHVQRIIRPALAAGKWVVCDRFIDSTRVYQGGPGGADPAFLEGLERAAIGNTRPDLTIVLDLPVEVGLARLTSRKTTAAAPPDRFERDDLARHEARRQTYLAIAAREPRRCVVIDATGTETAVATAVFEAVKSRLMQTVA
jgi:dTMP kinase